MLNVIRNRTHAELGAAGAEIAIGAISAAHQEGREANVLLAAAPSQLPVLRALIGAEIHKHPVRYFHMDEYVGLTPNAPQAFGAWLKHNYFDSLPSMNKAIFERIEAAGDPQQAAAAYAERLPENGFDLVLCGIGVNGHLAFNDPGTDLNDALSVRHIELAEASRTQQVDEGLFPKLADVPQFAITLTIPSMLKARTIICSILGSAKAIALKAMLELPITNELPATALKSHDDVTVLADEEALSDVHQDV